MRKFEPGRVAAFFVILFMVGLIIHEGLKNLPRQPNVVPSNSVNLPGPQTAPAVSISKIWPDGATPTQIIHIPDPQEPTKGLLEISLQPGQDIELDCDPFWLFTTKGPFNLNEMDVAVDSGDGFETDKEFIRTRDTDPSSTNVYWSKARVYRIRLAAGQPAKILNLTVDKKALEKPLPPVLPQAIGELIIKETGIHVLTNRKVVIDLTFLNNSAVSTMAVAMHDQGCIVMPCSLNTFLVASDGTPYVIDTSGLAGINGLRTRPQLLTSIEPGQQLKASLTFDPRGNLSADTKSFRLQTEIVVNSNFYEGEYDNYRETGRDFSPPYCKVYNVIFDIPVRLN